MRNKVAERLKPRRAKAQASPREHLKKRIDTLAPEVIREVEVFVDFLAFRDEERRTMEAFRNTSARVIFDQYWDNPEDAEYDRL